jgi:ProP effector
MLADDHPLRRLAERYPACFNLVGHERQPIKIGIGDELAALDTGLTPLQLRRALATYIRHSGYQCNIREGVSRIGLDGMPVGVITVEEAAHAKKMLAKLTAKRARQDAAKARLEQTAQPPKNEPQSTLADEAELPKAAVAPPGRLGLAGLRRAALSRRQAGTG